VRLSSIIGTAPKRYRSISGSARYPPRGRAVYWTKVPSSGRPCAPPRRAPVRPTSNGPWRPGTG